MSVSYSLRQVSSVLEGPLYRLRNEITDAEGSSDAVFVFITDSQKFSHYATAGDMNLWPDTRAESVSANKKYYRQNFVQRDWETIADLNADIAITAERVQALASDLTLAGRNLEIDTTTEIEGAVE